MFELDNPTWLLLAIAGCIAVMVAAVLLLNRAGRAAVRELDRRHDR